MKGFANLPPKFGQQIAAPFLVMFGGRDKLDCWLTRIADELADADNPANRPIRLDPSLIPEEFLSVMHRPKEVVDLIAEKLDSLSVFGYTAKIIKQGEVSLATVSDLASGHVIEEAAGPDPDNLIHSLVEKYGHNLEVVKE